MDSSLDRLTAIPREDVEALRKMWDGDLPTPRALGTRPALLIVDMTEGFVRDEFPTGWGATGEPCARDISRLRRAAKDAGAPVLYTVTAEMSHPAMIGDWLRRTGDTTMFPFDQPGRHHDIVPELTPEDDDIVFAKPKPSAFFGTQLEAILNALGTDCLIVTGMTTSGCVRATVNDGFMLNRRVIVPRQGVADRSQLSHQVELFDMGVKYADIVEMDSLIADLADPAPRAP